MDYILFIIDIQYKYDFKKDFIVIILILFYYMYLECFEVCVRVFIYYSNKLYKVIYIRLGKRMFLKQVNYFILCLNTVVKICYDWLFVFFYMKFGFKMESVNYRLKFCCNRYQILEFQLVIC